MDNSTKKNRPVKPEPCIPEQDDLIAYTDQVLSYILYPEL